MEDQPHGDQREDEDQDAAAMLAEASQARAETAARVPLEPDEEREGEQREGEQEAQEPHLVPDRSEELGADVRQAIQGELAQGSGVHTGLGPVAPREIDLDRPEQERAGEEGNQQAEGALAGELARGAPAQRKPAPGPRDHEEEGHPPREEEPLEHGDHVALLGVLDLEAGRVEDVEDVEKADPERGDDAEPVEIVQALAIAGDAFGLL